MPSSALGLRRFVKPVLLSAAALLAVGAIALGIAINRAASAPELKPRIEQAASEFLGRPLTIDQLEWRRWPNAVLVARGVRLYEDPLKRRLLVDAPVVEARVEILSVLKLAAGITELRFVSPRISLRRDEAGEWNAARIAAEIAARPDEPARRWGRLAFNWFVIQDGVVTVEDEGGALSALPVFTIQASGKLRFGRKALHFPFELNGRLAGSPAAVKVAGDLGGRFRLSVDVKNGDPSLARLAWPPAARWSGRWDGTLRLDEGPAAQWRLRAAPLVVSAAAPRLDSLELSGEYVTPSSATFAGVARSSATEIRVAGAVKNGALDLDLTSPKADAGAAISIALAAAAGGSVKPAAPRRRGSAGASAAPLKLTASISVDQLLWGPADLRSVRAYVSRSTGPYVLERLAFRSGEGTIAASGSYLPAGGDAALKLAWKTSGVGVQDLFLWAGSTRPAEGVADSEGRIVTGLGDRFLPAMNGTVKVDLKRGWFGGTSGLLKVLTRLNIATLFAEAEGRRRRRVPFDEARGSVTILKGKISADKPLVLENQTLQMAFMGTYDLPTQTVDGRIVVNFLTVTDELIGLIPGVRDILLGKEKGLIPIWVQVKGKAADPDVEILQARTIAAPVWNTLRHVLRLPKTLFEKLQPAKDAAAP